MRRVLGNCLRGLAMWIDPPEQFKVGTVFEKPNFAYLGNAQEILDGVSNGSIDYKYVEIEILCSGCGGGGGLGAAGDGQSASHKEEQTDD